MYAPDVQWWPPHPGTRPQLSLPTAQQLYDIPFHFASYRPEEIGCVSRIASRSYPNDDRNKRFLRTDVRWLSDVNFDLLWGYPERYIRASTKRSERAIHHILTWWLEFGWRQQADPRYGTLPPMRPLNFDFVVRRGHLAKVLVTPHIRYGWKLAVTLFRGTYFLLEVTDDEDFTEAGDRINYMGHKFEQYMTSATPGQAPNPSDVLDMNEAFYSLVTASLKSHSLLLCAEVDSEDPTARHLAAPTRYVELKTTPMQGEAGKVSSVKKLRWWAQSFLGGVPRILVGFKNDEQTVVKCKMFDVTPHGLLQAAPPAREMPDFWKPAVCMNFLAAFLSFVKEVVVEDNYALVHVFSWNPHEDVHYSVKRGPEHCFLLPQYVQCVMTQYR
ncbi:decapping and exoribonuclease protein-like [Ambystoma mexicanum]|uniref:decapping and exoribonuclease protein-like n=1 Tax=Ambystoma mexicanum TaxID=8296 RepID=UPI0037E77C61